jgi:predicted nucleic-acid-binding protein
VHAVDTNILARALVRDDPAQSAAAEAVLTGTPVFIPVTVMLELECVLRSRYGFTSDKLSQAFTLLCALPNVTVGEALAVRQAATRLGKGWDFADALHHALSEGCEDFLSFDDSLVKRAARTSPRSVPRIRKP